MPAKPKNAPQLPTDKALTGILAVLVADREERLNGKTKPRKSEVVLADAGLGLTEIASLTGKNYDSVKTTVRRGRKSSPKRKKS